ncbi:arylacetamide deacetylase-like 4 [Anolis carolinensis]|uniref:Alpha/beta hydrolase fold-3 domain-containing protein n=1 Tax=Anolis carolinensis TaxID=28377 RepID=H9GR08_ANOCA|nr:PREDICTED: arylacetamide deacetylase-like 3 [Anolis carolinensis]|eukprot:XP_003229227.2 PREDICTED: arylacetamide deacetylase-like 3 [Anolis carolinensis]
MLLASLLWTLVSYLSVFVLVFLFVRGVCYDIARTHIPQGVPQSRIMRFTNFVTRALMLLGVILEKLGICHRYKIWRVIINGIPLKKSSKLTIKDLFFDEIPVRVYWPKTSSAGNRRGVVLIHGGVGLFGSIQAYERVSRYIARKSDSVVVSVEFCLAPEHLFPAPVLDCCTATTHFLKNATKYGVDPNRIVVCGDSSGGTFAAAVSQHLATKKDLPKLRAQILLYPFLQVMDFNLPSYQQNHSVPPLFKKRAIKLGITYLTGKHLNVDGCMRNAHVPPDMWVKYRQWINPDYIPDEFKARGYVPMEPDPFNQEVYEQFKEAGNIMFAPLVAEDDMIRQLPETFLVTCEYDVLRDDGLLYKKRLEDNGVPVTWHHIKDGFHGIMFFIDYGPLETPSARSGFKRLIHFLEGL